MFLFSLKPPRELAGVGGRGVAEPDATVEAVEIRWTRANASRSSASLCWSNGSRLLRTVPENQHGVLWYNSKP